MSQAGRFVTAGSLGAVTTLTGNSGGAVPPTGGNINVVGDGITINVVGTPGTSTLTISSSGSIPDTFAADSGTATPAAGVITMHGTGDVSTSAAGSTVTFHGEGVTAFIANSGTATASLNAITIDGGTGITTSGAGSIVTINASGSVATTFAGDSGTATPSANTITMAGGNNITTSAAGSTVTYSVSGTTNHAVQVGNAGGSLTSLSVGTNGQVLLGSTGANPSFVTPTAGTGLSITTNATTLQYALSTPVSIANGGTNATSMTTTDGTIIFDGTRLVTTATGTSGQVLTSNGAGVAPTYQNVSASGAVTSVTGGNNITITGTATAPIVNVSGTTNHSLQLGNASGSLTSLGVATNGQIPIGLTGADPVLATLTAGTNIVITNGAGSITIAADTQSASFNYTGITFASSPYTALSTDYYIGADVTLGAISVLLPNAPATGRAFVVKDKAGLAATNNITVTTVAGIVLIDGATSFVMNTAYEAISLIFNGTAYEVY